MTLNEINTKTELLTKELRSLDKPQNDLYNKLKAYPSNNDLRKQSRGNKDKFLKMVEERDLQTKALKEEIEAIEARQMAIRSEMNQLQQLPAYINFLWETEGKLQLEANTSEDMLSFLKEEGYNANYLFERAKDSLLAREILISYEGPKYGRGYQGYSMSTNAYEAQESGEKPMSKWSKEDLEKFNSLFGTKTTLKNLKEFLKTFGETGKHHTSKFYNETMHYSISSAILNSTKKDFVKYFGEVKGFTKN